MIRKKRATRAEASSVRSAKQRATLAQDYAGAAFPKHPPVRAEKLRAWIAKQPCMLEFDVCRGYQVHAAHVATGTAGVGMKGDDLFVPLCFLHHIGELHGGGARSFELKHGVDLRIAAERYREEFRRAA